jgi:hypothetical protein
MLTLLPALSGCAEPDNPYNLPPMIAGMVRLDATLADATGSPLGTKVTTRADGVRIWLIEAGQVVDSTLVERSAYVFSVEKNHSYRIQAGIRPAFVDSTEEIIPTRSIGYYPDTLRLGRRGDLAGRPNPFSSQAALLFGLAVDTHVELAVYDLSARRVRMLASRTFVAGLHALLWDGLDDSANMVPAGMYWVLFQSISETRAELLIKQP